jgi:hypothetical protein
MPAPLRLGAAGSIWSTRRPGGSTLCDRAVGQHLGQHLLGSLEREVDVLFGVARRDVVALEGKLCAPPVAAW